MKEMIEKFKEEGDGDDEEIQAEETEKPKVNKKKNGVSSGGEAIFDSDDDDDKKKRKKKQKEEIEIVPELKYDDYDADALAEMRILAQKMLRQKDRDQIIEDTYNRYSTAVDEDAPEWFLADEAKHRHKIMPITKEEYAMEKARINAILNKPIKKVSVRGCRFLMVGDKEYYRSI